MSQIKAEYIDHMGDDLRVVNAARVSFNKESELELQPPDGGYPELSEKDKKLIKYLATHDHFTPFTHPMITLRETVPIFVARQRFKHVVGFTYNEVSRRYVDDEPEFYVPDVWRSRPEGSAKQGSGDAISAGLSYAYKDVYRRYIAELSGLYQEMIEDGIAPEQARMVLPQSMMTSYYTTGSLAAFARMVTQRKDSHAQKEIQDLAKEIDKTIRPLFPVSWQVLVGDVWYEWH